MRRYACLIFVLAVALPASARADLCDDYRMAIDSYTAATDADATVEEVIEAAKSGIRAARASRNAIKALTKDTTLEIIEIAGASDALEAADAASTEGREAFEAIYDSVRAAVAELAEANVAALEEARVEADEAAEGALDSLSKFKAMTRRTALKAASAAAGTSPGPTTSKGLIATHENIYGAACGE